MIETSPSELIKLGAVLFHAGHGLVVLAGRRPAGTQRAEADENTWSHPRFQQILWDDPSISSIGPGQSVITSHSVRRICMEAGPKKWPLFPDSHRAPELDLILSDEGGARGMVEEDATEASFCQRAPERLPCVRPDTRVRTRTAFGWPLM